ncbi:MAG: L-asparaginase/archaeal glu-tRNAgln amidotransferase subunit D [uncultured archaeon A07HB70]|nr:MAG: L-asparaginase/archaeal glu-tRNAgln amidotransferase subunit D [uncultured archaeon A07HB70]
MTVRIVSTGGTIASTADEGGDATPTLSGDDLVAGVPALADVADVETEEFASVPSPHLTVDQLWRLTERVRALDADPGVDGVVVTHGTSTLEESAYFVDLCYDGETPVVFTGAMRNPSLVSPDGPGNLLASVRTATTARAGTTGVLVTLNDRVHAAREVTKTHASALDTFRAPEFGPLAVVEEDRVTWRRRPVDPDPTFDPDPDALTNDVAALWVTVDAPERQVRAAADAAAVCVATTGSGGHPERLVPALRDLREAGVPLVATTRCPEGRLGRQTYGFTGSHATLRSLDAYFSDLNLQKTRVRTIVALAAGRLDDAFDRP